MKPQNQKPTEAPSWTILAGWLGRSRNGLQDLRRAPDAPHTRCPLEWGLFIGRREGVEQAPDLAAAKLRTETARAAKLELDNRLKGGEVAPVVAMHQAIRTVFGEVEGFLQDLAFNVAPAANPSSPHVAEMAIAKVVRKFREEVSRKVVNVGGRDALPKAKKTIRKRKAKS